MAGPLLRARLQIGTAAALRRKGYGVFAARRLSQTIDDDTIELAVSMAPPEVQAAYAAVADQNDLVGGSFLDAIIEFLNSDFGKMLIDLLMKLLLGLI